jgi:hypothetical protein
MAWEGYRSRVCKCNDFNVYGIFGRDNLCPHHDVGIRSRCSYGVKPVWIHYQQTEIRSLAAYRLTYKHAKGSMAAH